MTLPQPDPSPGRAIRLEVEAPGTPEELWEMIATGPGITSWFVPAQVDPDVRTISLNFGPGMDAAGTITVWEPPHRFAYTESDGRNLFYEFIIEARDGGTCVVRLINSGFGEGANWDHELESMTGGWKLFMHMLTLSRTHFAGQPCSSVIVNAMSGQSAGEVWTTINQSLGLRTAEVGDRIEATGENVPPLAGTVVRQTPGMLTVLLEQPAPGVAFVLAEPWQDGTVAGLYLYLFGEQAAATLARDEPAWRAWLERTVPSPVSVPAPEPAESAAS
jgi:uncharacterized protein YndB with AHSA1/START domain